MFLPAFRCLGAVAIVDKNLKCCLTINESKTARDIAACFFVYLERNMHHHRDLVYVHFRSLLLLGELCANTELTSSQSVGWSPTIGSEKNVEQSWSNSSFYIRAIREWTNSSTNKK